VTERKITREELRDMLHRRRYAVPNAVTIGNMFCGYLAIMYATTDRLEKAVIAVLIAILLDGLDGRVARRLNATSRFGIEFDSFSDVVSFGIAPAVMMYHWAFHARADEFGVAVTFFYALCAASRLARFNISAENLKSFSGLPTPGAAVFVVAVINTSPHSQDSLVIAAVGTAVMLAIGYLMVSTIEFFSIKQFRISGVRLRARLLIGVLIALTWYSPPIGLLGLAFLYAASGPFDRIKHVLPRWLTGRVLGVPEGEDKVISINP
jgi:CDP-diacylglycerol--serine O-phosphatidyltransferase